MEKYRIIIEETCVQEFEVLARDAEEARKTAQEKYKNGSFVLTPGEVQYKQMAVLDKSGNSSGWMSF